MTLTDKEKSSISSLSPDETAVKIDDESRSMYQFEVEKVSGKEWRVSKWAVMCLDVQYFSTAADVIGYIER